MNRRYRVALILLAVICIFNIFTGFLLLYESSEEKSLRLENNEVLGFAESASTVDDIGEGVDDGNIANFCYRDICKSADSLDVEKWIVDGKLSKDLVDGYIEKEIRTYFKPFYDAKKSVVNRKGSFLSRVNDSVPDYSTIYSQLVSQFNSGVKEITVVIPDMVYAGTDGEFNKKYIEVDSSQQRLYVWNSKKIDKVIDLSGPRHDSEVHGVFTVVDKGLEPIAPGNKYMPYWLAFYYEPSKAAWYGLHGLIWMYRDDGTRWIEPSSNIGVRISGGCIRMLVEDAKYLYERFEKGDYILIHP